MWLALVARHAFPISWFSTLVLCSVGISYASAECAGCQGTLIVQELCLTWSHLGYIRARGLVIVSLRVCSGPQQTRPFSLSEQPSRNFDTPWRSFLGPLGCDLASVWKSHRHLQRRHQASHGKWKADDRSACDPNNAPVGSRDFSVDLPKVLADSKCTVC
jgi:hypothetical protein